MINFDDIIRENVKEDNANWWQISDYPYIILIIWSSGSGKNALLKPISQQPDIHKTYSYAKDLFLINKRDG